MAQTKQRDLRNCDIQRELLVGALSEINLARRASAITTLWSLGIGTFLTGLMLVSTGLVAWTLSRLDPVSVIERR